MIIKKECPYCHSLVEKTTVPYAQDYQINCYFFHCDCSRTKNEYHRDERDAYLDYLEQREQNNLTNFDVNFNSDGRTFKELNKDIENYCYDNPELVCQNCFWGKLSQNVPTDAQFPTCIDFCEWLLKKVNENV